jgi:hypothetical protein
MPNVVESRKAQVKSHGKAESTNTNGEDVAHTVGEYYYLCSTLMAFPWT